MYIANVFIKCGNQNKSKEEEEETEKRRTLCVNFASMLTKNNCLIARVSVNIKNKFQQCGHTSLFTQFSLFEL